MLPRWEVVLMILGKFFCLGRLCKTNHLKVQWRLLQGQGDFSLGTSQDKKCSDVTFRDLGIFLTWHESTKRASMPLQGAGIFSSLPRRWQGELTKGAVMPFGRRVKFPSLRKPGKAFAWRLSWKEHANLQMAKQKVATTMLRRWHSQWCVQRPKHSADGADEAHSKSCYLLSQCYFCINL